MNIEGISIRIVMPVFWLFVSVFCVGAAPGDITLVAGSGSQGGGGDGGPATSAQLNYPTFVFADSSGNLYISDSGNNRIRKVDVSGRITTIAGSDSWGKSGDNGPAAGAQLNYPTGIWGDTNGNLYISDSSNHRIRKVDASGIITTAVNGESFLNSNDDIVLDKSSNLYISDSGNNRVLCVHVNGSVSTVAGSGERGFWGDGGSATQASLNYPRGVALDAVGNLYIADSGNNRIRKVDLEGIITTVAGNGKSGGSLDGDLAVFSPLRGPKDVVVDEMGTLYFSDFTSIRRVDKSGVITTLIGGYQEDGTSLNETLGVTSGICLDKAGNLFFARGNQIMRVERMDEFTPVQFDQQLGARIRLLPYAFGFGTVLPGERISRTLTIFNDALAKENLTIHQISRENLTQPFDVEISNPLPVVIPPGQHMNVTVVFSPSIYGSYSTQVMIDSDDSQEPTVGIKLSGYAPNVPNSGESMPTQTAVSPKGHFLIHYDTRGIHAVDIMDTDGNGIPDYVEEVCRTFDFVWTVIVDQMGYRPPPSDGDSFYDVHIRNMAAQSAYGFTFSRTSNIAVTDSYIEIDNNFTDPIYFSRRLDGLHITAAHNFFKAVQLGYYADFGAAWWQNITATWMEDVIYDEVNDYHQYLDHGEEFFRLFFDDPTVSLDYHQSNLHSFGASVFAHYLARVYKPEAIRHTWEVLYERRSETFSIEDLDAGLPDGGFAGVLPEFAIWNYFTSNRAREGYYKEAHVYPEMPVKAVVLKSNASVSDTGSVNHLAADYIRVPTQGLSEDLFAKFVLDLRSNWALRVLLVSKDNVEVLRPTEMEVGIPDVGRYQEVVFIPVSASLSGGPFPYSYEISFGLPGGRMALDLNLEVGDQQQRETTGAWRSGDVVAVDLVALSGAAGSTHFQIRLAYDPGQLDFVDFRVSDLMAAGSVLPPVPLNGILEINGTIQNGQIALDSGSLGQIGFKILDGFSGEATVTLLEAKFEAPSWITPNDAHVSVHGTLLRKPTPDFDHDGKVGFSDFLLFVQAFGSQSGDEIYDNRFDLTEDGKVGFNDFLLFAQAFGGVL